MESSYGLTLSATGDDMLFYSSMRTTQRDTIKSTSTHREIQEFNELIGQYIDFLLEENEQITQMSKSYSVPTPLNFEREEYFQQVCKSDHSFPTERFRVWLDSSGHHTDYTHTSVTKE